MNIKKIFSWLILLLMAVQFQWSCNKDKTDTEILSTPVNEPQNDYMVVVEIISFSGLGGCASGFVEKADQPITDAKLHINRVPLINDSSAMIFPNYYADTLNALSYNYFTRYQLTVEHQGKVVATGSTVMPSIPFIKNLNNPQTINVNDELVVKWEKVEQATALQIIVGGRIYDPVLKDSVDREFDSGLIEPNRTSITIPDTLFRLPGTYVLGIVAFNGLNPGALPQNLYDEQGNYHKGYNLEGAAGLFLSAMVYPDPYGLQIVVKGSAASEQTNYEQPLKPRLKELVLRKTKEKAEQIVANYHKKGIE